MSKKVQKIVKGSKKTAAKKVGPKIEQVHAGGGIMVDVVSTPKAVAKKTTKKAAAKPAAKNDVKNPYRVGGGYWATVEALKELGTDQLHAFDAIVPAVIRAMGDKFKDFKAKDARNAETGKDATARIIQNVSVVARKDYGEPLRDKGYEVRFEGRNKVAGLFKI